MNVYLIIGLFFSFGSSAFADDPFLVGNYHDTLSGFQHVSDVVIGPDLTVYAADRTAAVIRKFNKDGNPLENFALAEQALVRPVGLAFHGDYLVVVDQGDHAVKTFALDGRLVARWGKHGGGKGELFKPSAVASNGEVLFVADSGNHRVVKSDIKGELWQVFGQGFGTADSNLIRPAAVAVGSGPQGLVYVADTGNNRLAVYSQDGSLQKTWGSWGAFDDMLDQPSDLRFVHGHLYITDRRNHRIHTLSADLTRLDTWGIHELFPHEGGGKLHYPQHFDIAPDKSFAVIAEPVEDRIQRFISRAAAAPPEQAFVYVDMANKSNRTHFAEHLSTDGQLLVMIEPENHFLVLYDLRLDIPVVTCKFSERGTGFGLMMDAHSPVLDAQSGKIFVADAVKRRIQEFRFQYDPQDQLGYRSDLVTFARALDYKLIAQRITQPLDWPFEPQHMTLGPDRLLYILDQRNHIVFVFDQEFAFKRAIQLDLKQASASDLVALAVAPKGALFIADGDGGQVYVFSKKGTQKQVFGQADLLTPAGITLSPAGTLFVTDRDQHQLVAFDGNGKRLRTLGTHGDWMGELWKPKGVAVDAKGRVIVVDQGNHRGQIFEPAGKWLVTFGLGRAYTYENPPKRRIDPRGVSSQ